MPLPKPPAKRASLLSAADFESQAAPQPGKRPQKTRAAVEPASPAVLELRDEGVASTMLEAPATRSMLPVKAVSAARKAPSVLVSNEVGSGIVPDNAEARRFRDLQGRLNQRIAARADRVVLLVAGLPMVVKGQP